MIKKAAVVVVSGLILIVAAAFFIYPTPYKYLEYKEGDHSFPVKSNVLTGTTQFYIAPDGWTDERPSQ